MPLSAEEQRRLAELEESLTADDPAFTRNFVKDDAASSRPPRSGNRPGRRRTVLGVTGMVVGLVLLVVGVEWTPVVSVIGFVTMLVSALLALGLVPGRAAEGPGRSRGGRKGAASGSTRERPASRPGQGGRRGAASRGRSGPSFSSRMEERWKRRSRGEL